ncbi:MAG TPA: carboxypeptidase regulatory-like domain-containing protein, partial [Pyrinomonadaceae bacterium]|nr:carboxypeptidase regulatory-like domain-containing protein [Pyrinomonadaceae bacterium]
DAQTRTVGNISGTVRDPTSAVVPGARVVIQEQRTGFSRTVVANDEGFYSAPSLPFGRYSVSTAPPGFKKTQSREQELHVNENLVVNLTLEIGPVTETVIVSNDAAPVDTRSGEVSSLVSSEQVTELPLNGRNYAQLVLMVPGVSPTNNDFKTRGTGLDSFVGASVNGNGSNQNLWTVDGVNNMDVGSNHTLLVYPSIDSIQEFRVERNSFSAEFGQAQGAVVNLITKGGTNEFHGTAFEFLRNDKLNASDFFLNRAGQPKAALRYNNFGFNFNGPIKKNRAFFFWSEEWRRERRGLVRGARVPTASEKLGDFTGFLTDPLPHDPATCRPDPNDPTATICDPFPGNRIPANRLSGVGLALLKVYSDPNNPGDPGQNWVAAPKAPIETRQDLIRGNVNITSKVDLMIRWISEDWVRGTQIFGDSGFPTVDSDWAQLSKSLAVKLTSTLSSSSVNEFQFSRSGNDISITTDPAGQALNDEIASMFPTVFPHPQGSPFPTLFATDGYAFLLHAAPWGNKQDLFIWKDDFSKVRGAHDLKVGGLFSHNLKNEDSILGFLLYRFCGTSTRTGNAIADTLLKDLPLGCYFEADHQERVLARWHDLEFYGNDTWKVRPTVTLTFGLRWSRYGQPYSANDRITNFIPRLYDGADPNSALVKAGASGFSRALVKNYDKGFQPRVGLAWDLFGNGKTALRGGAGRYLGRTKIGSVLGLGGNPPWTQTVDAGWGGSSSSLNDSPSFRSLDTINPGLKNARATTTSFNAVSEDFRPPESWQWNLTISREVMKNTVVEASYIGNHALHIERPLEWNEVVPSARLAVAQAVRANDPSATGLINAGRRLPGVASIFMTESTGDSSYNALQVWANRRFSDRLAFQGAYTWSHAITNVPLSAFSAGATDPFNYNFDDGDADLDRRQMFVTNAVYLLPSFRKWGAVANQILGNWQLNAITSLLGGIPIDVTSGANTAGLAISDFLRQRPNLVLGVPIYLHNAGDSLQYLNPAAFSLPEVGQFGSLGRGSIRGPRIKNFDLSVVKNWRIRERYNLQFRAEMFNAFNHANFKDIDAELRLNNIAGDENFGKPLNPNFGRITATQGPREIQFGLKFSF